MEPARATCPFCKDPLTRHPTHGDVALVTHINGISFHSGHCESEILRSKTFGRRATVTGFPMPTDLQAKYRND